MTVHERSTLRYNARQTRHEGRVDTQRLLDDSIHVLQVLCGAEGHVTVLFESRADLGDESAHDVWSCTEVEDTAG
jgi:hypothetical protein